MARAAIRQFVLGLAATGLLAGCVDSGGSGTGGATTGATVAPARGGAAKDVEAPEVFQTTDSALWDGRPSLGGIWVASPDVVDPERVVMFNPATGKSINGALFRRERENPGPKLQLSSDAAEALGILAGQPTEIQVTAIRKVEPEAPAEEVPAEAAAAQATDPAATDPATPPADPAAAEAAAIAAAALEATGVATEAAAEGTAEAATAVVEEPKRKTWKERRAEAKAKREAAKAAKAAEKAAAEAAAAGVALPVEGEAGTAAPTAETAGVDAIETAPLDARAPEATAPVPAPVEEPRKTRRQQTAEADAAAAATPAPAPVAGARPIQIASFSKEENAQRAVDALAKIGITAQPQKTERGGKAVWGVVAMGDQALLAKIKDAGFADAYFLQ